MGSDRPRTLGRHALAAAGYVLAAIVLTWPLARYPSTLLGAPYGPGDPFLNLWVLGWDLRTISIHPSWLLTGRVFDANIFFPAATTLAYTDHLLLQALAIWPVYAASGDLTLCYNLILLGSLVLSAWAMFAFVNRVLDEPAAAWAAGLVWGFAPFRFTHLIHLQLQALYWLPLLALAVTRLVLTPTRGRGAVAGVVAGAQTLSSIYWGLIGGLGAALLAVDLGRRTGRLRDRRYLTALAVAAVVAVLVAAPGVWPYWRVQQRDGFTRNLFEAAHGSAVPASFIQAPAVNALYGRTGWLRPGRDGLLRRVDGPEQDLFPGFVVILLAAAGVVRARRVDARAMTATLVLVGLAGLVLSFGPNGFRPLYAALFNGVFGFQAVRAPARFAALVLFSLAALAAIGLARRRAAVQVVCTAAIAIECFNGSIPYVPAPRLSSSVGTWLAAQPDPGPVLYLPLAIDVESTSAMLDSLQHGRPIVNGYSGQRPAFYPALVDVMSSFPSAESLLSLRDLGVRYVVTRSPIAPAGMATPLAEQARLDDGAVYELRWTPAIEASLAAAVEDPAPPYPGPLPFASAETLTYLVRWLNGPMTVPAGEATFSATRTAGGYTLTLTAATAPWLERFYSARDTLVTEVTADLLPVAHRQVLQEGRRDLVKTAAYDREARRITVQTGDAGAVTLPLSQSARDPLSAFLYLQAIDLSRATGLVVPVTDLGRALRVEVVVARPEAVAVDGVAIESWRVEPRLSSRAERRPPPRVTVWVTRDARRLPIRAEVDAEFGRVALELVSLEAR